MILHGKVDKYHELDRLHDAVYPLALKYEELVSFYPISENELEELSGPSTTTFRKRV